MERELLSIGELARRADCSVPTVRYYETVGLMPPAQRSPAGQRVYARSDLARLNFIRRCREMDIPLERISELLAIEAGGKACGETLDFFKAQREAIKARIAALRDLDLQLSLHISACQTGCSVSGQPCSIFDEVGRT